MDGGIIESAVIGRVVREAIEEWKAPLEHDRTAGVSDYRRYVVRKWLFMAACAVIAIATVGVALTIGDTPISVWDTYVTVWNHMTGDVQDPFLDYVIVTLRMPRIVVGLLAGAGLAACGAVMQSIMMNPLTDPYTTGVSSGAMFGVTVAMVLGFSLTAGQEGLLLNAFVFSLIPTCVIIVVSKIRNVSPTVMVMAGIAVMYLFNAMTTVLKLWATDSTLSDIYIWSVGSLSLSGWSSAPYLLAVVIPGVLLMMVLSSPVLNRICTILILITTVYSGVEYFIKNKDVFQDID